MISRSGIRDGEIVALPAVTGDGAAWVAGISMKCYGTFRWIWAGTSTLEMDWGKRFADAGEKKRCHAFYGKEGWGRRADCTGTREARARNAAKLRFKVLFVNG